MNSFTSKKGTYHTSNISSNTHFITATHRQLTSLHNSMSKPNVSTCVADPCHLSPCMLPPRASPCWLLDKHQHQTGSHMDASMMRTMAPATTQTTAHARVSIHIVHTKHSLAGHSCCFLLPRHATNDLHHAHPQRQFVSPCCLLHESPEHSTLVCHQHSRGVKLTQLACIKHHHPV